MKEILIATLCCISVVAQDSPRWKNSTQLPPGTQVSGNDIKFPSSVFVGNTVSPAKTLVVGKTAPQVPGLDDVAQWDCHARSGGGTQWGCGFFKMFTDSGQSTVGELDGILSGFWHYFPFTVPIYKSAEVGGGAVSGASAIVSKWFGVDANHPTVSSGGSVGISAPIHISNGENTGIVTPYAIWSESPDPSLLLGPVTINEAGTFAIPQLTLSDSTNTTAKIQMGTDTSAGAVAYVQAGAARHTFGYADGSENVSKPGGNFPVWEKYLFAKVANGAAQCSGANANTGGCWTVNGTFALKASATVRDDIPFATLTKQYISAGYIETVVACSGATTIKASYLGDSTSGGRFTTAIDYDLIAAVSATNNKELPFTNHTAGRSTASGYFLTVLTTVANVDQVVAGCSFSLALLRSAIP